VNTSGPSAIIRMLSFLTQLVLEDERDGDVKGRFKRSPFQIIKWIHWL
jgi:hypothetical protein